MIRRRSVVLSPEAIDHLGAIYDWIAQAASPDIALGYIGRLEAYVRGFDVASERGTLRNDVRPGLRVTGFERRITVAFTVSDDRVEILGFYAGGQNWEDILGDSGDLQ